MVFERLIKIAQELEKVKAPDSLKAPESLSPYSIEPPPISEDEIEDQIYYEKDKDKRKELVEKVKYIKGRTNITDLLEKYNLKPIQKEDGFFLGAGSFSKVYRVDYHGKQIAAKITNSHADINNYLKIMHLVDKLPKSIAKHLPRIYDIINDEESKLTIILSELLVPVNFNIKEKLSPDNFNNILKNKQVRHQIILDALYKIRKKFSVSKATIKFIYEYLENILVSGAQGNFSDPRDLVDFLQEEIAKIKLPHNLQTTVVQTFRKSLWTVWQGETDGAYLFPEVYSEQTKSKIVKKIPEFASLMNALEYLQNHGMYWADMHQENILERPGTHELVIADPGAFSA